MRAPQKWLSHCVARLDVAVHYHSSPGGKACRGQRRGFFVAVALRSKGECMGREVDNLARESVHAVARDGLETAGHSPARLPVGEEARNNGITHGKLGHAFTNGSDYAGTIGHWDTAILRASYTGDYAEVVVVERAAMDAYLNLARLWRAR